MLRRIARLGTCLVLCFGLASCSSSPPPPLTPVEPLSQPMPDGKRWTLANLSKEIPRPTVTTMSHLTADATDGCIPGRLPKRPAARWAPLGGYRAWRTGGCWQKSMGDSSETGQTMAKSRFENCWLAEGPVSKCSSAADAATTSTRVWKPMAFTGVRRRNRQQPPDISILGRGAVRCTTRTAVRKRTPSQCGV